MPKDKVIAYFSKYRLGQNASSNHENGIPLVPKNRDDRKVLVDAGNRCVVPAKSRPKKRKTVKPLQLANKGGNGVTLGSTEVGSPDVAESVLWSEQGYTVRHLVKQFDGQFPVIVRVDEGHYREEVVDLSRGQVLLVSDYGKQQRVLARNDSTDSLLSLPVDYQMDILVTSSAEVVDFTTAVKEMRLPFAATVYSVSPLANTLHGNFTGERLTFLSIKDTVFLRANSISHGWVDQSEILVIPELVQVQFSASEGLRGGTEQEWHDYQGMFARCVRHLSFDSMTGFTGILLEGPDGNELMLASTGCLADNDPTTVQSQALQAAKDHKKQRIAYENLRLSVTNQGHEDNLRLNSEDSTNYYDNILLADRSGNFAFYDNIGAISQTPESGEVLSRSGLERHPSNVRLVSCSNSTLDYRRPRENRSPSKQEHVSASANDAALNAGSNDLQSNCTVVSKTNSEIINQIFDDIVDLNRVDQTLIAAEGSGQSSGLGNIQPVREHFRQDQTPLNLGSNRTGDGIESGSLVENPTGQVHGKGRDMLNRIAIDKDVERENPDKKESTSDEASGPVNKVNVLHSISKFQSSNQPHQAVDASPFSHPLQSPEGKGVSKHAGAQDGHSYQPKSSGLDKPKPVITGNPKPGQVNLVQPPQRPPSTNGMSPGNTPTVANGVNEEPSRQPNRWQQLQKSGKPPNDDSKPQTTTSCSPSKPPSAYVQPPPPLSRTPFASNRLPDSNPNRMWQQQISSNRKTNDSVSVAAAIPNKKPPTPPANPIIPVAQRSSVNRDVVIKSSADVPSELESLSVEGVSQCLELLHLDTHVTDFNRSGVDGRKLTDLTEKGLEQQFQFTPLDASKLVRFVRGWRP